MNRINFWQWDNLRDINIVENKTNKTIHTGYICDIFSLEDIRTNNKKIFHTNRNDMHKYFSICMFSSMHLLEELI